jgi:prenyltransferase beta subunit
MGWMDSRIGHSGRSQKSDFQPYSFWPVIPNLLLSLMMLILSNLLLSSILI